MMVTPDTNVIVRLLTQDDEAQYQSAHELFQNEPKLLILHTILLETEWVLRFAYGFASDQIGTAFQRLLGLPNVEIEEPLVVSEALKWHAQGMDFADALHVAQAQTKGCEKFVTFDKKLVVKADSLSSLSVKSL